VPEPILVSIAAALATKSATSLYELVKRKFTNRKDKDAIAALEAANGAAQDSQEVAAVATHLAAATKEDPAFEVELRNTWQQISATQDGVVNQITGNITGKVVQARDIEGGISFT